MSNAPYVLPDLDYDYSALEPVISGKIMELHHGKHHATYVKAANEAVEKLEAIRSKADMTTFNQLTDDLSFNVSGHVLHSIFWKNLGPDGGGGPDGPLLAAIEASFGSVDTLRALISHAASKVRGSGWGALVWEPMGRVLLVEQIHDHQQNVSQAGSPLLVLDAWEHAFYLQYGPDRAKWAEEFWKVVNWADVARRYEAARGSDRTPLRS